MFKHLTLTLLTIFSIANAQALPIIQADAFSAGDNKAIIDTSTGLTWLDFGVNKAMSFNDVMDKLNTTYVGWRLPTQNEVYSLWDRLLTGISSDDGYEIFDIWGANRGPHDHSPYSAWGYFIDDNGYLGHGALLETGNVVENTYGGPDKYYLDGTVEGGVYLGAGKVYDGSLSYYPFNMGIEEISTLLVRDTAVTNSTSVPEPSAILLFGLGLFGLALSRRRKME